jgi:dihydroorotase
MRVAIEGGRVIDPASGRDGVHDLYIADGYVAAWDQAPDGFVPDRVIRAAGRIVCPGLVDLCAQPREPGLEHKATIASETQAAAAGGITTLCCPPDTDPIIDTPAVAALVQQRALQAGFARVLPIGALTCGLEGEQLSEMAALKGAGCIAVANVRPVVNTLVLRRAMEYAATHGLPVFLRSEDAWLTNAGCVHEGVVSARLGLPGIPEAAETAAVARDLALVEQTGVRAHFCRLSTARAVHMVARAQYDGLPVSADVCAHQLYLTEMDVSEFDSACHVLPPARTTADRQELRAGVARGTLGAICSDHQPHEADAKLAPFVATEPGVSALETLLALTLRLVDEGLLSLTEALARLTAGPARILGIDRGQLATGAVADVCIFDPQHVWRVGPETLLSRGKNTPFLGWELRGRVTHTLLGGRVVYELEAAQR